MALTKVTSSVLEAAQTNITSVGTLTTLTVDDITINGSTISDGGSLTIDSGGDIILDAATDGRTFFFDNGTEYGHVQSKNSDLVIGTGVSAIRFHDSATSIRPATTSDGTAQDGVLDLGSSAARWKDLYLSGSAFIGGTTSANALDDYEEGTWTPVLIGSDTQSGQVYATQQGTYTKIGRQVNCQFNLNLSTEGSFGNNYILLSGFPFTISSSVNTVHLGNLYFVGMAANYISIGLQAFEGNSKAYLWAKTSATASREYVGTTDLTDSTQLTGQFTYFI